MYLNTRQNLSGLGDVDLHSLQGLILNRNWIETKGEAYKQYLEANKLGYSNTAAPLLEISQIPIPYTGSYQSIFDLWSEAGTSLQKEGAASRLTPEQSKANADYIRNLQDGIQKKINAYGEAFKIAGNKWNPAEAFLALSAQESQGLWDELGTIENLIRNANVLDADRDALYATNKELFRLTGKGSSLASGAGAAVSKATTVVAGIMKSIGFPGIEAQSGSDEKTFNKVDKCIADPASCVEIPQPFRFLAAPWKALALGAGGLAVAFVLRPYVVAALATKKAITGSRRKRK